MSLVTPLARTARRRAEHFNPDMVLPSRHHPNKLVPKSRIIMQTASRKGGINIKLWKRAKRGMQKVEGIYGKSISQNRIRIRQALLLDEIAADSADFAIDGFKQYDTLISTAKNEGVKIEVMNPVQIETAVWEKMYAKFIKNFRNALPQSPEILRMLQRIKFFTKVPLEVHFERAKHWNSISKIERDLLRKGVNPEENLLEEVKRILSRNFKGVRDPKKLYRLRALDIVVASSIYADLLTETKGRTIADKVEKQRFWDYSYSDGMEKLFPLLEENQSLLESIINFNRESPRRGKLQTPSE